MKVIKQLSIIFMLFFMCMQPDNSYAQQWNLRDSIIAGAAVLGTGIGILWYRNSWKKECAQLNIQKTDLKQDNNRLSSENTKLTQEKNILLEKNQMLQQIMNKIGGLESAVNLLNNNLRKDMLQNFSNNIQEVHIILYGNLFINSVTNELKSLGFVQKGIYYNDKTQKNHHVFEPQRITN